jgi:SAM-dependent methyltransferase
MTPDARTLAFYDARAGAYADHAARGQRSPWLTRFAEALPEGATVLDLGCGSGWAAAWLRDAGFAVSAMDASARLAAEALRRYALPVTVAGFERLTEQNAYDGIWASFCLLHEPRAVLPSHLCRIARALRPGALLYLGLKEGIGEGRDRHGRFYTYVTRDALRDLLERADFGHIEITLEHGTGFAGTPEGFLHCLARNGSMP